MAQCKGCIHDCVCNRDVGHGYSICPHYIQSADVVPKSEVEMLQGALKAEERHNELTMEMAKKALANSKAEVARGIFEDIEAIAKTVAYPETLVNGIVTSHILDGMYLDIEDFAKLKNKYTEESQ